ncbi:universal stress protein UspA (plasmid) [Haloferax mediterranei ATCC 33500]|uniref:Universal stress protein UspA n=1 Tax=Haloferax mediterranei (strain ATCC 33500 / DSM 1411 / JCM 8866 / NBRC 14739 / NCIMB 2177 / R-4) TaxID=523841 RepID=A0A059TZ39_HALMT|nr:universal stress protein [Haloferax mediterranei]AHZ24337.1 universal stress protein UspA [Haloferax mediterranei ATCC 33500]
MYEAILVPTDGSDGTEEAIEHAIDLAGKYDAELHAIYVIETHDITWVDQAGDIREKLEARGERAVNNVLERAESADIEDIETSIIEGKTYRAILTYVDDRDIDLVVMGTHGRTGLDRYLLGSVTEKIVRLSDIPVLTVPLAREGEERSE